MKTYSVSVLIGTTRIVEVEAENEDAAMEAAELELADDYDNEFMIEAQEVEVIKSKKRKASRELY